jgi:hypothetical protein
MLELWLDSIRQWLQPTRKKRQIEQLKERLQQRLEHTKQSMGLNAEDDLTQEERAVIEEIRKETRERNRNNLTRTSAYLDFYKRCPEVHWAFLAHMVSRNGGWNMTDLRGSLLSDLLSEERKRSLFYLLERANWLIFGDAYPQLLLYERCKQQKRSLLHLLPFFHVSIFMQCMWEWFLQTQDSELLATALITNEQQYIETHLMQNESVQENVLDSMVFRLQEMVNTSVVLFPLRTDGRLIGLAVDRFVTLERRIEVGKQLYAMLFRKRSFFQRVYRWACSVEHTGSRADFWPHRFTQWKSDAEGRIHAATGTIPYWSPRLQDAWPDQPHQPVYPQEWVRNAGVAEFLAPFWIPYHCDMTERYRHMLTLMEAGMRIEKALT